MKDNQILPSSESAGAPLQSQSNPPHRILVVEDEPVIRRLNAEALVKCGYEVDVAEDGAAAWDAIGGGSYDLVITDNFMPKVTGVELLKKLRAARMVLPVIMATGTLPMDHFAQSPWLQPDAMLLKPYTFAALLVAVKKALREAVVPTGALLQQPANSTHRILAVDEDKDIRLLYADALAGSDYRVDGAEDGAAAWEALQAGNYNLLITEHDLPKLTGVELVRKLRAAHMALPVVMAAGRLPTHELARTPSLQLAATLLKPFAVEALRDTVKNVLRATISPPGQIDPQPDSQDQLPTTGLKL